MNAIFVANKPSNISSNHFLSKLKRKYKCKKAGFSGTLDPFASGNLIVAFGSYTKLFNYIKKSPKRYRATLWFGLNSDTLDIDGKLEINFVKSFDEVEIKKVLNSFVGEISYIPPSFSAKKINGQRAYKLARNNQNVVLNNSLMSIYEIKILNYSHPFLSFEVLVSEGAYIRSLAKLIADKLNTNAALSSLVRLAEGSFSYEDERFLNAYEIVDLQENFYLQDILDIKLGKKLKVENFRYHDNGIYKIKYEDFFAIIQINDFEVKYKLNLIK